jgi:hypothetical protein
MTVLLLEKKTVFKLPRRHGLLLGRKQGLLPVSILRLILKIANSLQAGVLPGLTGKLLLQTARHVRGIKWGNRPSLGVQNQLFQRKTKLTRTGSAESTPLSY